MTRAFVFPGQGSQAVGMGRELSEAFPIARQLFQEVDDALSQKLSALMFEGPEADLTLTENAQPALMAMSLAVVRVLECEGNIDLAKSAAFVAGHSLGESSALAAAGAFTVADTARLLKIRGQAMQQAVPVGVGAMVALLGSELELAKEIAAAAVDRAIKIAAERGIKRAIPLPVSAPFHCALMQPAADAMEAALAKVAMTHPRLPLVANVTANRVTDPDEIRALLVRQVTGTVRWRESVLFMKAQG
ncbi:MAG: ACP S-malonyltransferase, partial [Rhodospirillaceae bacterium]|nr:ACP S-malonyltransferase [Rhodospirillaceae bacterium]